MINDIANKWLTDIEKDLVLNYDKLGLRASGKWAQSLEQFYFENTSKIVLGIKGEKYTEQLENGRKPNAKTGHDAWKAWATWASKTFIKDWINKKGLSLNAFGVAYNIAKNGWKVPNKNNAGGLVSNVATRKRMSELVKQIGFGYSEQMSSEIYNFLNKGNGSN